MTSHLNALVAPQLTGDRIRHAHGIRQARTAGQWRPQPDNQRIKPNVATALETPVLER